MPQPASDGTQRPISDETRDALSRVRRAVQQMRDNGENDLRSVLHMVSAELAGVPLEFEEGDEDGG